VLCFSIVEQDDINVIMCESRTYFSSQITKLARRKKKKKKKNQQNSIAKIEGKCIEIKSSKYDLPFSKEVMAR
jgi:hypothetical protein